MNEKTQAPIKSVAVTGGLGNLGSKLLRHLAGLGSFDRLVGLDYIPASKAKAGAVVPGVEYVECDLADHGDRRWRDAISSVDAIVHFAARNPYPEATWEEAAVSLDMTLFLVDAARASGRVKRFVFATSNHVMGRYKDEPLASTLAPGGLGTDLPPGVGALWHTGLRPMDSTAYATAKLSGERACRAAALGSGGKPTFVAVRIGWCQAGENLSSTLSAAGTTTQTSKAGNTDLAAFERDGKWFRDMWLSNGDFCRLFERAVLADGSAWKEGYILVNGMSANRGMKWDISETRRLLGYEPRDDAYR